MLRFPAAQRNREPILKILKEVFDHKNSYELLEIGCGSGEHTVHFASYFNNISFYPTDIEERCLKSVNLHAKASGLSNIMNAQTINVLCKPSTWFDGQRNNRSFDCIYTSNLLHISPWKCTLGLFSGVDYYLKANGFLLIYGPFKIHGVISPQSNVTFDQSLRSQNKEWGLREVDDIVSIATDLDINLSRVVDMPANNKILIFQRVA